MKRLFWSLLGLITGSIVIWFFSRRHMDDLYAEISRLREYERKEQSINERYIQKQAQRGQEEAAELADMTPEERIDHEMRMAEINSYIKSIMGEKAYNELTTREGDSENS